MQQVEVVMIKSKLTQLIGDIEAQTEENLKERAQLHSMMEQFDEKYAKSLQLQDFNQLLSAQHVSISQAVSKDKVILALKQKAQQYEEMSKLTAQAYTSRQIDDKAMMKEYIASRSKYHAIELQKVKIAQS